MNSKYNSKYTACNGYCEECEFQKAPRFHPVKYRKAWSSNRPIAKENPLSVTIPVTDNGMIELSEF